MPSLLWKELESMKPVFMSHRRVGLALKSVDASTIIRMAFFRSLLGAGKTEGGGQKRAERESGPGDTECGSAAGSTRRFFPKVVRSACRSKPVPPKPRGSCSAFQRLSRSVKTCCVLGQPGRQRARRTRLCSNLEKNLQLRLCMVPLKSRQKLYLQHKSPLPESKPTFNPL